MTEKRYGRVNEREYSETLPNGLRIFYYPKPGFSRTYAMLAADYGSIDSAFTLDGTRYAMPEGIAHYLEHKMFEQEQGNALQKFAETGARPNAFTNYGMTAYHFSCTSRFEQNLELLLQFVFSPHFTQENVTKERGIIGQEIQMMEDMPEWKVLTGMMRGLYHNHPIKNAIAGSIQSIAQITPEKLQLCYDAFYRPDNMVLVVVGAADFRAISEIAMMASMGTQDHRGVSREYGVEPEEVAQGQLQQHMAVSLPLFMLGIKDMPSAPSKEYLRNGVIGDIAAHVVCGETSPLYTKLYENNLINHTFAAEYVQYHGAACATFSGQSHEPQRVQQEIQQEMQRYAHQGIPEAYFERIKRARYGAQVRALDTPEEYARKQISAVFGGGSMLSFPTRYDSISASDICAALLRWTMPQRSCLSVVMGKDE